MTTPKPTTTTTTTPASTVKTEAPKPRYADLVVEDAAPIVVTRARKARELSALATNLKASYAAWKIDPKTGTKVVKVRDEEHGNDVAKDLRADGKTLGIGVSLRVENVAGQWQIRFQGRSPRKYTTK